MTIYFEHSNLYHFITFFYKKYFKLHRYLIRTTSCGELVAEVALAGIERFPLILSGILMTLTATTGCGELSIVLGAFCQFVHLFSMYKVRKFDINEHLTLLSSVKKGTYLKISKIWSFTNFNCRII